MIFTHKDIELLKLIAMCKYLPSPDNGFFHNSLYDSNWINLIKSLDLISISKNKKVIRPKPSCYRLLDFIGVDVLGKDIRTQYNKSTIDRGIVSTNILLTFYEAGVNVDYYDMDDLSEGGYFSSTNARKIKGNKKYGSTRFYGMFTAGPTAYMVFHPDDIGIHVSQELRVFGLLNNPQIKNTAVIFMGASTKKIAAETFKPIPYKKKRPKTINGNVSSGITFHEAFNNIGVPIHFIPFGPVGASMLKFMQIPNCREVIATTFMGKRYKPPYEDMPYTDAVHYEEPFYPVIFNIDMDVKRIDRAVIATQEKGYGKIIIFALEEQIPFLMERYGNSGSVIISAMQLSTLNQRLGGALDLYIPSDAPYEKNEKEWFIAENIAYNRKIGNQTGEESE